MNLRPAAAPSLLPALALLAFLAGCGPQAGERGGEADTAATAPGASPGLLRFERSRGAPGDSVEGHAVYVVTWPHPTTLPLERPLADSLRAAIAWAVAEGQSDAAGQPLPADSLAARFLGGHAETRWTFPEGPAEWNIERAIRLEVLPSGPATLRIDDSRYEGGAHGMTSVVYQSFDAATGRRLRLADLASGAGLDSLSALGERAFRAEREVPPGADLKSAGFFVWDGGGFELPENFGVTAAGLVFHWNPYDIAPYAAGPTTITLPWPAVRPHLKPEGPLAAAP